MLDNKIKSFYSVNNPTFSHINIFLTFLTHLKVGETGAQWLKGHSESVAISPAVEWVYLKMFVKVFFSFDYSNIGVL